jgi:hypothetical protein
MHYVSTPVLGLRTYTLLHYHLWLFTKQGNTKNAVHSCYALRHITVGARERKRNIFFGVRTRKMGLSVRRQLGPPSG